MIVSIACEVGIAGSTLYHELARGIVQQLGRNPEPYTRYFDASGQRVYEHRRQNSHCPIKPAKAKKFVSFAVKQILTKHPAPDTICGLAGEKGCFTEMVCSKTIYNYIERGLLKARNIDITRKVKRKQHRKGHPQHKRLYGLRIEVRPQVVNRREEFGYWDYAHPYSAYERGLNEEQNRINQLPRNSFHYSSPEELFQTVLLDLAI